MLHKHMTMYKRWKIIFRKLVVNSNLLVTQVYVPLLSLLGAQTKISKWIKYEHSYQEWNNSENLSPGIDGCSENNIGGGVCGEVVHGENVANML